MNGDGSSKDQGEHDTTVAAIEARLGEYDATRFGPDVMLYDIDAYDQNITAKHALEKHAPTDLRHLLDRLRASEEDHSVCKTTCDHLRDQIDGLMAENKRLRASEAENRKLREAHKADLIDIRTNIFALHEDTVERYHPTREADTEGEQGAYAGGRMAEAKGIARAMGEVINGKIAALAAEVGR